MKLIDASNEFILSMGWTYKGSCHCGGMLTYKYELKINGSEYKIKARSTSFSISKPGQKFIKLNISELKRTLNEVDKSNKETTP